MSFFPLRRPVALLAAMAVSIPIAIVWGASPGWAANPVGAACPSTAIHIKIADSLSSAVSKAATNAAFCIETGIHRLQTATPKNGQKFYAEPGAILSGARILTQFTRSGTLWVAGGQTQSAVIRGDCADGYEGCTEPLGFFINNVPLRHVTSKTAVKTGTFFYDHAKGEITFADAPTGKLVEATVTRFAIAGSASDVLINGLIVEKYYNPPQEGAVRGDGSGWKVEKCEVRYNSGTGVSVNSRGVIQTCNIHHNGQMGATADGTDALIYNNNISYNNIYGFNPDWDAGGVKVGASTNLILRANKVRYNHGPGLWCDESCLNTTFDRNVVEYNDGPGIFYEISSKAVISNNTLRQNNQAGYTWYWGAEIQIAASDYADIYGNNITVGSPGRGIMLIDQNREKDSGGYFKTQGNAVHNNTITYLGEGASGGVSEDNPDDANFGIIKKGGNIFNYNTYKYTANVPADFPWDLVETNFAGFQKLNQEKNGTMSVITGQ